MKLKRRALIACTAIAISPTALAFAGSTTSDSGGFGVDPSYKQCAPLLASVHPKSEAQRVFKNCMAMHQQKGTIDCGNGVTVKANRFCPGNKLRAL